MKTQRGSIHLVVVGVVSLTIIAGVTHIIIAPAHNAHVHDLLIALNGPGNLFKQFISLTTKMLRSIRMRGLQHTILYTLYEFYFDFKYNVETRKTIDLTDIGDIPSDAKLTSVRYQATPYYFLRQAFARIAPELAGAYFLDYGCGKGRVLLLATEFGVRLRYGVEYSESLCRICRENLRKAHKEQDCLVICQDAAHFVVPSHVNVIFLFNPFKEQIVRKVAEQIKDSLDIQPRKITILYYYAGHEKLFLDIGFCKVDEIHQRNPQDDVSILRFTPTAALLVETPLSQLLGDACISCLKVI